MENLTGESPDGVLRLDFHRKSAKYSHQFGSHRGNPRLTFLATEAGAPFAANGFTHWFRKMCVKADLPLGLSAHGLRKAACRRLAEAGCSANQIAAISGHATLHEVSRYTKAADQKRLAADAMRAIATKPKPGTASGKPAVASGKHSSQAVEKKR